MNKRKFKIEKLKSLIGLVMVAVGLITDAGIGIHLYQHKAPQTAQTVSLDDRVKPSVVKLRGMLGSCSGEQVLTESGKAVILTAMHCSMITIGDEVLVFTQDGRMLPRKILAISEVSDLMILEGMPNMPALPLAKGFKLNDNCHAYGSGMGYKTSRQDGQVIDRFLIMPSDLPPPLDAHNFPIEFFVSTAHNISGMSGGPVVDDSGQLIGLVSMGNDFYGYDIPLDSISAFLTGK